jgi:hypothetical protein
MNHPGNTHQFPPVRPVHFLNQAAVPEGWIIRIALLFNRHHSALFQVVQNGFGSFSRNVQAARHLLNGPTMWPPPPEEQQGFQMRHTINLLKNELINLSIGLIIFRHWKVQNGSGCRKALYGFLSDVCAKHRTAISSVFERALSLPEFVLARVYRN